MKRVFDYSDYRTYINDLVKERKSRGHTKAELSRILGCQAAYLSQVLMEKASLTEEHLLRLSQHMEMNEIETEYLLSLLRLSKAGTIDLGTHLKRRISHLLKTGNELEARLASQKASRTSEMQAYYVSSWVPSLIHVATSCESLQSADALEKRFGLSRQELNFHLIKLEKYGLIRFHDEKWIYEGDSLHFPKDSPFDQQLQTARRLLALDHMAFRTNRDLHYSVVFAADSQTAANLRSYLLDAIEKVHRLVEPCPGEDVYSISLDLFRP